MSILPGPGFVTLVRPVNLAIGALGVLAGALSVYGADVAWGPLLLTMLVAVLGMAGGNAINDAADAALDARGHPDRPIPKGQISSEDAFKAGYMGLANAVAVALLVNLFVAALAAMLAVMLLLYERFFKRRGLLGNLWISWTVASTFLLGALGGNGEFLTYGPDQLAALVGEPRLLVALAMASLALLANTAREIYKDIEDLDADRGYRSSLPMVVGEEGARRAAAAFLIVAIPLALLPIPAGQIDARFGLLVAPALAVFLATAFTRSARTASLRVKLGMALALPSFLAVGLL